MSGLTYAARMATALPLFAPDIERTLLPRKRATQLPPRAFTDPDVHAWELEHVFRRGWIGACHVNQVSERGQYVMVEVVPTEVVRVRRAVVRGGERTVTDTVRREQIELARDGKDA